MAGPRPEGALGDDGAPDSAHDALSPTAQRASGEQTAGAWHATTDRGDQEQESEGASPPSTLDLPAGHMIAGRYSIVRKLGEGSMGVVFEARDTSFDRRVAVKLLHPELILDGRITERFAREARTTGEVKHVNIVEVYEAGSEQGRLFLVMEFLEGETLRQRITREAPMKPSRVVPVVERIASALAALHLRDIVHRDVKPDNIHLHRERPDASPVPKLLDFGLAKSAYTSTERLTRTGTSIGTPMYMAPEQAHGARHVTGAADQYALAVILYEALSGEFPHQGANYYTLMLAKLSEPAVPLHEHRPDLPAALCDAIMRAMSKEPEQRFDTIESFRQAILPYATLDSTPPPRDPDAPRKPGRALGGVPAGISGPAIGPGVAAPQPIEIGVPASPVTSAEGTKGASEGGGQSDLSGVAANAANVDARSSSRAPAATSSLSPSGKSVVADEPGAEGEAGLSRGALLAVVLGVLLGVVLVVGVALARRGAHSHSNAPVRVGAVDLSSQPASLAVAARALRPARLTPS